MPFMLAQKNVMLFLSFLTYVWFRRITGDDVICGRKGEDGKVSVTFSKAEKSFAEVKSSSDENHVVAKFGNKQETQIHIRPELF